MFPLTLDKSFFVKLCQYNVLLEKSQGKKL